MPYRKLFLTFLLFFTAAPNSLYAAEATDLLLALSWEPAFCEKKSNKPECKQLNNGLLATPARQLSLHGLWPQPKGISYCGVSKKTQRLDTTNQWSKLPSPQLDKDTAHRLAIAMPGTASFLERHEWIKHGTCFSDRDRGDEYFDDSLYILNAINGSQVGQLLANNIGKRIETRQIRRAFDNAFGTGAGKRVSVHCTTDHDRVLIQEIQIALHGTITPTADIGTLIRAGQPQKMGCSGGIVDPAGQQ